MAAHTFPARLSEKFPGWQVIGTPEAQLFGRPTRRGSVPNRGRGDRENLLRILEEDVEISK